MSARYATWIRIGGRIEHAKSDPLLNAIRQASVSLEWGDATFEPQTAEDVLAARKEKYVWLCDDQASNGAFPELETACRRLGLGYSRHTEGALDCDAELVDWRPGMKKPVVRVASNVNRETTFAPTDALRSVLSHLEEGRVKQAIHALRKLCPTVPELPPFEII